MLFLLFQIGSESYAIEAERVVEVLPLVKLKSLPQSPAGVAGVFTYRGRPVPVLDLCELALGRASRARRSTRLLLIKYAESKEGAQRILGVIVEYATTTMRKHPDEFMEAGVRNDGAPYLGPVVEVDRGLVQWVRVEKLLPPQVQELLFTQVEEMAIG